MADDLEIVVGTYEEFLLGYKIGHIKHGSQMSLSQTFAMHSHTGSVRAVASNGRYLASGGADDRIYIYDMKNRKELQILMHHDDTVNTLEFTPGATHLISGGSDGYMAAVRVGSWQLEKLWKAAHKGTSVNNLTIHPTGKMALSLGGNFTLCTWNLVKGRRAYITNLGNRGPNGRLVCSVHWSSDGNLFAITGAKVVEVWSIATAAVVDTHEFEVRVASLCWLSENKFIVGLDNGKLIICTMGDEEHETITGHTQRVKCIAGCPNFIATACSAGIVKLWSVSENKEDISEICSTTTGCRVTCITIIHNSDVKLKKLDTDADIDNLNPVELDKSEHSEDEDEEKLKQLKRPKLNVIRKGVIVIEDHSDLKYKDDTEDHEKPIDKKIQSGENLNSNKSVCNLSDNKKKKKKKKGPASL